MLKQNILEKLPNCQNETAVIELLKDEIFPGSNNSRFIDSIINLPTTSGEYSGTEVTLSGIPALAYRIVLLLKFHGHINDTPLNSGKMSYARTLLKCLATLSKIPGTIMRMDTLNKEHLEIYVKQRDNEVSPMTLTHELYRLGEWIVEANPLLPYFLRLDENILTKTPLIQSIYLKSINQNRSYKNGVGSTRRLYALDMMKHIVAEAINYIDNYAEEILKIAPLYVESRNMAIQRARIHIVNSLQAMPPIFKKSDLVDLQKKCKTFSDIPQEKNTIAIVLKNIKELESACILIGLLMTGMRVSEFSTLQRFPKFRHDDHAHITRIITKTALDEEGEEHEMPIPSVAKKAIETLSHLSMINDGKQNGHLVRNAFDRSIQTLKIPAARVNHSLKYFCNSINVKTAPTPHQLRHTMAFIIAYLSEGSGLELARLFLGHSSIAMTLRYLGQYNHIYREAIKELEAEDAQIFAKILSDEIRKGNKLYGKKGEYITQQGIFMGSYASKFADLLELSLMEMVKQNKIAILQTPICFCIHDLTNPKAMECQKGLQIDDFIAERPLTGRCQSAECSNACFTEGNIQRIQQEQLIKQFPIHLKERLMQNLYVLNDGGIEEMKNPLERIIASYMIDKGA